MGGHLGGEFASKLATSTVEEVIREIMQDSEMTFQSIGDVTPGDYRGYLKYAVSVASNRIFERAGSDPSLHGMGTTIVVSLFRDGKLYCANVGDSRCYLIRGGKIKQLTVDHSLVGEQLRAGVLKPEDARTHKFKNIITRSVGFQENVDVDVTVKAVKAGDRIVMCTDGLTNMVAGNDILTIAGSRPIRGACNELIELANHNGGDDNITVLIAEVTATEEAIFRDEETAVSG
jgi:protein phosphatase